MTWGSRSDQNQIKAVLGYARLEPLRRDLQEMLDEGYEVIPSENCGNQAPTGHCLGHESIKVV